MKLIQEGPREAKVMILGEAPGKQEALTGRPFIGGSGEVLNRCLERAGLDRDNCFLTNLCHVQPPDNDFQWFMHKPNQHHYVHGVFQLMKDITEIKPNIVIALGNYPLRTLTEKVGITKWRGSLLWSDMFKVKVIGTYHPAASLRVYPYKALIEFDLKRAAEEMSSPELIYPLRQLALPDCFQHRVGREWVIVDTTPDHEFLADDRLKSDWLSVDIECWQAEKGGTWTVACVGFADNSDRALVLDWKDKSQRALATMLCESNVPKVLQNGSFDFTVLKDNGVSLRNYVWDTMAGHHVLYMESSSGSDELSNQQKKKRINPLAKGLGFQTSIYTREPYYKDDGKLWKQSGDIRTFWRYNALDAAVTFEIRERQAEQITKRGLQQAFSHKVDLIQPLLAMSSHGILSDVPYRDTLKAQYESEVSLLMDDLTSTVGSSINVKGKAVQALLYETLGLPVQYNKKTGNPSVDKFALSALSTRSSHPVLLSILRIRERRDLIEHHLNTPIDLDGRMRCGWNSTGTNTDRLSSSQNIYGSGTNLQNIPSRRADGRRIRRMFVADPGTVFIYADYSQAEARIVAHAARCQALIDLFNDPDRDVHSENASRIFNIPLASVGKDSLERFLAKQGVHAGNYGQGPKDLAARINAESEVTGIRVTESQCADIQNRVRAIYPEIQTNYWKEVEYELRRYRRLRGYFGSERVFYDRWDDKLLRSAYAFKPQNAIGQLCCKALVRVYSGIQLGRPDLEVRLLLNVHDALLQSCKREHLEEAIDLIVSSMSIPVPVNGKDVFIPVDVKVGLNFANADVDNPFGLQSLDKWKEHE